MIAGKTLPGYTDADQWARYNAAQDKQSALDAKRKGVAAGIEAVEPLKAVDAYKKTDQSLYPVAAPPVNSPITMPQVSRSVPPAQAPQQHGGSAGYDSALAALRGLTTQPAAMPALESTPASVPAMPQMDLSGAQRNAFARAKDQVGETATGAMAGLRSALAGRGMMGGGLESRGAASVVNTGQKALGDVSREQAIDETAVRTDEAKTNQAAALTQRGQDLSAIQAKNSLAVEQATAQSQIRLAALQQLVTALKPSSVGSY